MDRNDLTRITVHVSLEEALKRLKAEIEEDLRRKGYNAQVCHNEASRIAAKILNENQKPFNLNVVPRKKRKSIFYF